MLPNSRLCFGQLSDSETEPTQVTDTRIHFNAGVAASGLLASTTTNYNQTTGLIYQSTITVDILNGADVTAPQLMRLVGFAVGLDGAAVGADSVMAKPVTVNSPTTNDRAAVAVLYGTTCPLK